MKKSLILSILFSGIFLCSASAQSLSPSAHTPVADGIISDGEYATTANYSAMKLGTSLSSDGKTLYMALEAPSTGWVAIGLGSLRMSGSYVVFGYDANGTAVISEETGIGHSHKTNTEKKLSASAVREVNKSTVLEFSLPAAEFLNGSTLKLIMAYGKKDNLTSLHSDFDAVELQLKK